MTRILNAIKLFAWALKNPQALQHNNFKMLSDLFTMIMKVSTEHRPRMTQIAYVHPEEGEKAIVSIWAGASMEADPVKRIGELLKENAALKQKISEGLANPPQP